MREEMISYELRKMGVVVVNIPMLKSGFAPQVILKTYDQAQTVIKLKQVQINSTFVSVRPCINIRRSSVKEKITKLSAIQTEKSTS